MQDQNKVYGQTFQIPIHTKNSNIGLKDLQFRYTNMSPPSPLSGALSKVQISPLCLNKAPTLIVNFCYYRFYSGQPRSYSTGKFHAVSVGR